MSFEELKTIQLKIIEKDKKYTKKAKIIYISILAVYILFIIIIQTPIIILLISTIFTALLTFIITFIITAILKNNAFGKDIEIFNKNFKNTFVLKTLQNTFSNLVYDYKNGFSKEYIEKIGILDTADNYYANDYIYGKYKNIEFEQSNIHIEKKYEIKDNDGNLKTEYRTIFEGRVMTFDFNKKFKHNIQLTTLGFEADKVPSEKEFNILTLDDDEFNDKFCVKAENEIQSFILLTPAYMNKMKEFANNINEPMMICFIDNKLHIALDNHEDAFEWDVFEIIDETKIVNNLNKDINIIIKFVEELNKEKGLFR